jgi:hypothetical protein
MNPIDDILQEHADAIDAIVDEFITPLQGMIDRASRALITELRSQLDISGGTLEITAKNQKILASMDARFLQALDAEGYQGLLDRYTSSFNGQFDWFTQVLNTINSELTFPLPPVNFSPGQMTVFSAYQAGSRDLLEGVATKVAQRTKQQAVLSAGAMDVKQLTQHLNEVLGTTMGESQNLAETSISTFYRTITDNGFQMIEEDLPGFKIRYGYDGPLDKLTRPFCIKLERLSRSGRTWTRAQIDRMNNGQIPNVFTTAGGYRCRHQWMIALDDLNAQQVRKGTPGLPTNPRSVTRESVQREIAARNVLNSQRVQQITATIPSTQFAAVRQAVEQRIAEIRRANA